MFIQLNIEKIKASSFYKPPSELYSFMVLDASLFFQLSTYDCLKINQFHIIVRLLTVLNHN